MGTDEQIRYLHAVEYTEHEDGTINLCNNMDRSQISMFSEIN